MLVSTIRNLGGWASKMTQWIKVLAVKPDNPEFTPWTHIV